MAKEKKYFKRRPANVNEGTSLAEVTETNMNKRDLEDREFNQGIKKQMALYRRQSVEAEKRGDLKRADKLAEKANELAKEIIKIK